MSYREREQDEGPDYWETPCGVCGVTLEEHGHVFLVWHREGYTGTCCYCNEAEFDHPTHDWELPSDNSPDEPDED